MTQLKMIAVVVLVILILIWWVRGRNKALAPTLPPACHKMWPIVGHAIWIFGDSKNLLNRMIEVSKESIKGGGVIYCSLFGRIHYMITDPDDTLTATKMCLHKHFAYDYNRPWLGEGLFTASVPVWRRHRKLLAPAFNQHIIDSYMSVFNCEARKMNINLAVESDKGYFHHAEYLKKMALDTIFKTAFGVEITAEESKKKEYMNAVEDILVVVTKRFQSVLMHSQFLYNFTSLKKREDNIVKVIDEIYNTVMQSKLRNMRIQEPNSQNFVKFKSFMDLVFELYSDGELTEQEVRDEVNTFIVSGHDTSSTTLLYVIMLIGSNPMVQERLFHELYEIFGSSDRDVTKDDLQKMVYLEAVIKETMRLYPIGPAVLRNVDQDVKLKNYTMRKGSSCVLLHWGLHRHPVWGPYAEDFIPERWLDPGSLPDNPAAFAAFSFGKRACIGKSYAMMFMKTTLAHVLRWYRVTADVTKMQLKLNLMMKPISGDVIQIAKRYYT